MDRCFLSIGISVRSHMELPYYAKYLLIAAYLASYNPAHTDKRFFTKQGRRGLSSRAKAAAKAKKSNTQLTGENLNRAEALFRGPVIIRFLGRLSTTNSNKLNLHCFHHIIRHFLSFCQAG